MGDEEQCVSAWRMQSDSVTSFYIDSNCTRGGEDLIMCLTVEPLCFTLETIIKLHVNDISIKKEQCISYAIEFIYKTMWLYQTFLTFPPMLGVFFPCFFIISNAGKISNLCPYLRLFPWNSPDYQAKENLWQQCSNHHYLLSSLFFFSSLSQQPCEIGRSTPN